MKNQSVVRVSDRIHITQDSDSILQICNATGTVQIDEQEIVLQKTMIILLPLQKEQFHLPIQSKSGESNQRMIMNYSLQSIR